MRGGLMKHRLKEGEKICKRRPWKETNGSVWRVLRLARLGPSAAVQYSWASTCGPAGGGIKEERSGLHGVHSPRGTCFLRSALPPSCAAGGTREPGV